MTINQINLSYHSAEDRLLLRINTGDSAEFRIWLTRSAIVSILSSLAHLQLMIEAKEVTRISAEDAIRKFEQDTLGQEMNFGTEFRSATTFPLGEAPLLLIGFSVENCESGLRVLIELANNLKLDVTLQPKIVMDFYTLIIRILKKCDWNLPQQHLSRPKLPFFHIAENKTVH